jgi:hypothetical protein
MKEYRQPSHHYVYLYRDLNGKPRYIGYGMSAERAISHAYRSHNTALRSFLAARQYRLEIAGPYGTEEIARAVETGLISALNPSYNRDPGRKEWRFRPLGVPLAFADRLIMEPLTENDLLQLGNGIGPYPILFVYINSQDFDDGRVGYNLANPPTDDAILVRIDRWWQLRAHVEQWTADPAHSPGLLVGVTGRPSNRFIVGAVEVDRTRWRLTGRDGASLYQVPTLGTSNLDVFDLRGRRISADVNIRFSNRRDQHFFIFPSVRAHRAVRRGIRLLGDNEWGDEPSKVRVRAARRT